MKNDELLKDRELRSPKSFVNDEQNNTECETMRFYDMEPYDISFTWNLRL